MLENDKAVSRQHAALCYDEETDTCTLEIMAKKGVSINGGGALTPSDAPPVLHSGDTLTIGKTVVSIFLKPKPAVPKKKKTGGGKKKFGRGDADQRMLVMTFKKYLFATDKKAMVQ